MGGLCKLSTSACVFLFEEQLDAFLSLPIFIFSYDHCVYHRFREEDLFLSFIHVSFYVEIGYSRINGGERRVWVGGGL